MWYGTLYEELHSECPVAVKPQWRGGGDMKAQHSAWKEGAKVLA